MSEEPHTEESSTEERYIPPPPSERSLMIMRVVFALLGAAAFGGVWVITGTLAAPWRIGLCLLVSAPFLLIPDLLRDKSKAPPGFKPRKWEDEDD
ncbi:MAG: hypothetical protein DIU74_011515 [Pseudomonadota bacterium]|nr:MAG: hypothetical protein DIU74_01125 [Pseudomonadota bacterium]